MIGNHEKKGLYIMKKLMYLVVIALYFCTSIKSNSTIEKSIINESDNDNFYPEDDILWIGLSYLDNEQAKEDVRAALKDDFDWILKMAELENRVVDISKIPIALTFFDLNHEGRDEIIAFVSNNELHGTKASGALYVIAYTENGFIEKSIAGFPLDTSTLDDPTTKQIGIINTGKEWDDLVVNSVDLAVSGQHWSTEINK